ncbi:MAG: YihY/virulence factor BrkB family protein [Actinobacteria bacterium]|nr:YihY/virulence factor BrkB family protein [Actinomycetota bacterium]
MDSSSAARESRGHPIGIRSFVRAMFDAQRELHLSSSAASAGFWLFLSIVPAAIAIVNVLGLVLDQQDVADSLGNLAEVFPGTSGQLLVERLQTIAAPSAGTGVTDTVLVVVCLWTISTAMHELLGAMGRVHQLPRGSFVTRRLVALGVGLIGIIAIGASAVWIIAADRSTGPIPAKVIEGALVTIMAGALLLIGAQRTVPVTSVIIPGISVTLILYLIGRGLTVYITFAPNMSRIYGTAAGVMAAMLAAYLGAFAVLLASLATRILTNRSASPTVRS